MPVTRPKPLVLVILDGWGHRDGGDDNAIEKARTPVCDDLFAHYPHGLINASELHVGLPAGQMGNSEVGHMNIGSGRVLIQDLPRIDKAIEDGSLEKHPKFTQFCDRLKQSTQTCHLLGLLSPGGVHSHQAHILALAGMLSRQGVRVQIHVFTDGRDTSPQSALEYMAFLEEGIVSLPHVAIATVSGRYYAMDRDKRWDRVHKAYDTMVDAKGARFPSAREAIDSAYASQISDEFILPATIGDYQGMQDGDGLMMANFRSDRVRETLAALLDPTFDGFARNRIVSFAAALGVTEYSTQLNKFLTSIFTPEPLTHILGEILSEAGLKQLRIAETEKYAHVTFFFNGGREQEFPGEERILVASPKVATYDLKPEMSAFEVTDKLVEAIASDRFDVIIANYANTDMVGHTGDIPAAMRAVEAVDTCLGKVVEAALAKGGALFVTADHGNAEMMFDHHTDQPHTAHTLNLVPSLLIADRFRDSPITLPEGKLGDVAPTLLQLLGLKQPAEMTGRSLLADHASA